MRYLHSRHAVLPCCLMLLSYFLHGQEGFVQRSGQQFLLNGKPYYFMGTNYWYGSLLALHPDRSRGLERLRKELDFLQAQGVKNLRVMAGAEGSGLISGVERVGPPLQPGAGVFDTSVLRGLDILLEEMRQRNMKAVIFFSNNWEWSGGFLQYLQWNGRIADSVFRRKLSWDEQRDYTSLFYQCAPCKESYLQQVDLVMSRVNTVTGQPYTTDSVIMAWELANEPRPMRPASNEYYLDWIAEVAAFVRSKDPRHLLTTGHEGEIGTESLALFEAAHRIQGIDYLTIHIWPRNWGWYRADEMETGFARVVNMTRDYIKKHIAVAARLDKPLVVEEFGFPRDSNRFEPGTKTTFRDLYYLSVFSLWKEQQLKGGPLAGVNFWAFNGLAKPVPGQPFWKKGDDYLGDPPMEEQGLYGVFEEDLSTWKIIGKFKNNSLVR